MVRADNLLALKIIFDTIKGSVRALPFVCSDFAANDELLPY